jgi:DNA-binding GntR family transcriptional regulator
MNANMTRQRLSADQPPSRPPRSSSENLTRVAYEKIRAAIVYGRLDLGEALSEKDLATALGMSKAPVRGALSELRLKRLVDTVPQSGTYVFSPSREEIEELGDFRLVLEEQALRNAMAHARSALLAALDDIVSGMETAIQSESPFEFKRLDTEFHSTFVSQSGNRFLMSAYETVGDLIEAMRYRFMDTVVYRKKAFVEHQQILSALKRGRIDNAADLLRIHVSCAKQFHATIQSRGRSHRKDYKFRNYSEIFRKVTR